VQGIKWAFDQVKGRRKELVLAMILTFIGAGTIIICPFIYSQIIDVGIRGGNHEVIPRLLAAIIGVTVLRIVVDYSASMLKERSGIFQMAKLRTALYEKIQAQPPKFFAQMRSGDMMTRMTADIDAVRNFTSWVLTDIIFAVVLMVTVLIVFATISIKYTLSLLVLTPATFFLSYYMGKKLRPAHQVVREKVSQLNITVKENIAGNRVIKAFVREDHEIEKFQKHNLEYRDANIASARVWLNYEPFINGVSNALNVVCILVGAAFTISGDITVGQYSIFINLIWAINEPVRMAGSLMNETQRFFASVAKVQELYYAVPDIKNANEVYRPEKVKGEIEFDHVSFKYDSNLVLDDVCIHAAPGETIGIMGPTGSGKSTIVNLISRFDDVKGGTVKIDGVDVRRYDLQTLRKNVATAMQDVFLFSDTIDTNISYGRPDMPEEEVVDCAVAADADGFIRETPQGYDTIIGERGVGLSGGQRQRVALARALAYDTPILLIDDTTSAVDMETESLIQQHLRERTKKATTVIIAQRISSVKHADRIYIIENGKITESGTHKELLAKRGYYYGIYCIQQGIADEEVRNG